MSNQIIDKALHYVGDYINNKVPFFMYQGSATGSNSITIPDSAIEVLAIVQSGATKYSATAVVSGITGRWEIGGYYLSSSDYGICNLNVSNNGRTYSIRNCKYAGTDYKNTAILHMYYR